MCITRDTIEVKSNPAICITVYKVFSPNDDDIHEFWEIENIQLYPAGFSFRFMTETVGKFLEEEII